MRIARSTRAMVAGVLKGHKVGRLWRIEEQNLEDFLEGEPTAEDLEKEGDG